MCGITGLFSISGIDDWFAAVRKANDAVVHRGPDGQGFGVFDTIRSDGACCVRYDTLPAITGATLALAHRRLAIIDLSDAGRQPMSNEDETVWIVHNGEVYNYVELRDTLERMGHVFRSHSDTEVILHAYETWGEDCVQYFNGIWAFALLDLKKSTLFCSRDRFGVKPFYYHSANEQFAFASEIKQLLCFPFIRKILNDRIVYDYLAYAAIEHCDETFFEGIHKIPHGNNLILNLTDGSITIKPYYNPQLLIDDKITFHDAATEFQLLLADSVRMQLRSDVEVGSCLSGGLDSSSIVCLMNRQLKSEEASAIQHTFSSHFDVQEANELEYMQEVIQRTGVNAFFIYPRGEDLINDLHRLLWHQDEPFGSTSIFAQWSVFKSVNQHGIKVMLDGQGADEQLAGYVGLYTYLFQELDLKKRSLHAAFERFRYYRRHNKSWLSQVPPKWLRRFALRPNGEENTFFTHTNWLNPDCLKKHAGATPFQVAKDSNPFGTLEVLNNYLYQLTFRGNLQQLLRYEDRNSMAFSVEARVPFLDHRIVELVFRLPSHFKIRNGFTKAVMREGMKGLLPEKIRRRTSKLGFATPERLWQQSTLRSLMEEAIQSDYMRRYIVPASALKYLSQLGEHGVVDFAPWRWLNLYLWRKAFENV